MLAHQVQHDTAVDVANRFVRRHLKIIQINFAHGFPASELGLVCLPNYMQLAQAVKD
jgi:hypothetical protein